MCYRIGKNTVFVQYYGEEYDNKIEEKINEGVWLYESNEDDFFTTFPQYKTSSKLKVNDK